MLSNKRHFIYNLITTYGNTAISIILSFITVPLVLNYWGDEIYGIWVLLISFSTYIAASGLGIDSATGYLMTKNESVSNKIGILKKGICILLCCSLISIIIIMLISVFFPSWHKFLGKMSDNAYLIAKQSVLLFLIGLIINLPLNAVSNSLAAFGKAYIGNIVGTIQQILNFFIILLTIKFKYTFITYITLYISNILFCNCVKLFYIFIIIYRIKRLEDSSQKNEISKDNSYKSIFKMGINLSLYALVPAIVPNLSNLIISNNINLQALVPYSLSYKLFSMVVIFVTNMNIALSPLIGSEFGKKNWGWIEKAYKKMFYASVSLSIFVVLGVVWLGKPFIRIWTGTPDKYSGNIITFLLAVYFFIYVMSNINHIIINSFNYTNKVWVISWADGILFLLLSMIFVKKMGIVGVPLGLCVSSLLVSSWGYPYLVYKRTEKKLKYDFQYLLANIIIFLCSICLFVFISYLSLPFILETIIEITCMIVTSIILILFIPKEIKITIISKLIKKNDGELK